MPALTDAKLKALEAPAKGQRVVFDDHKDAPAGFGVRITPKGKRSFVLRYLHQGKDRSITIGEHGTWTLAAARKTAAELRREIDAGTDIQAERRTARAAPTLADQAGPGRVRRATSTTIIPRGQKARGTL